MNNEPAKVEFIPDQKTVVITFHGPAALIAIPETEGMSFDEKQARINDFRIVLSTILGFDQAMHLATCVVHGIDPKM